MPLVQATSSLKAPQMEKGHQVNQRREKIIKIAKTVFTVLLSIVMVLLQTPVTIIGFIAGIAFKPPMEEAIQRIKDLFKKKTKPAVCALVLSSIIAFPIVFLAAGFCTGAYVAIHFPFTEH